MIQLELIDDRKWEHYFLKLFLGLEVVNFPKGLIDSM